MLTAEDVRRRVRELAEEYTRKGDNEEAHCREDGLWVDVLTAIAAGAPDAAELAKAALETDALTFERWYA